MRYTYLVGTKEELNDFQGQEFVTLSDARRYADNHDLFILEIEWEFSDSELIK
jgi:hypothetical protein